MKMWGGWNEIVIEEWIGRWNKLKMELKNKLKIEIRNR